MISTIIGWVKRLMSSGGSLSVAAGVIQKATDLFAAYSAIADLPDEAQAAFKEGADVFIALGRVALEVKDGSLPTRATIDSLQSERVQADMAFGRLIASFPTRD